MKFPNKVYIAGIPYKIKLIKSTNQVDKDGECDYLWAQCRHNEGEIRIWSGRTKEQIWQSLWHEVFHAMMCQLKLWKHIKKSDEHEEALVDGLALLMQGLRWE